MYSRPLRAGGFIGYRGSDADLSGLFLRGWVWSWMVGGAKQPVESVGASIATKLPTSRLVRFSPSWYLDIQVHKSQEKDSLIG